MTSIIKCVFFLVVLCSVLCGCEQRTIQASKDLDAILDVEDALNSGDAKVLRSMFTEDPVFVICNGPVVEDHDAIEKMNMDFFRENPGFKIEFKRQHATFPTRGVTIETVSFIDRFPGQPRKSLLQSVWN